MSRLFTSTACIVLLVGCSKQPNGTPAIDTSPTAGAAFNVSGAPTVEFSVPDMMCEDGCAVTVKEILSKQPGVKDVIVDFDAKTATVAIGEGRFDAEQALAALVDKQFDNSALKRDTAAKPQAAPKSAAP